MSCSTQGAEAEMTDLSRWQGPDGFPTAEVFTAVEAALRDRSLPIEHSVREDYFEYNLQLFPGGYQEGPLSWATELYVSWRCDELDEPQHPACQGELRPAARSKSVSAGRESG